MELQLLLRELRAKDIKLTVEGESLAVDAPAGVLTADLRQALQKRKTELLALLEEGEATETFSSLPPLIRDVDGRHDPFPLTDLQHAYWVGRLDVMELGNVANHGYYEIESEGLDLERLNRALLDLIDRHDMLRAIILPDGRQQVLEKVPAYEIAVLDLRQSSPTEVDRAIATIRQELSHQVLSGDRWPLFEFRATQLPGERVRLHVSYDLQIFDAWSFFRLFEEWSQRYDRPEVSLPPLLPFEIACWQNKS